jgi:uncharacterized protein YcbX
MANPGAVVGTVVSLWRYPVKSMQGEELNASEVTARGLLGDRAYALVDADDGKVASAKNPRKWPHLFEYRANYYMAPRLDVPPPPIWVTCPDGTRVSSEQTNVNHILSSALGRGVTLQTAVPPAPALEEYWPDIEGLPHRDAVTDESMPAGLFFDLAPVHVLTTATIDRLRELYPQGRFEVRRFRPNIVIRPEAAGAGFLEGAWVGRTLAVGDAVRLRLTVPCGRCVMTTLAQADLPKDPGILRTAVQHNQGQVGVYATVEKAGRVKRGDPVWLE